MTLEQFFATHRAANAIVVAQQQTNVRSAAPNLKARTLAACLRTAPESGEKH